MFKGRAARWERLMCVSQLKGLCQREALYLQLQLAPAGKHHGGVTTWKWDIEPCWNRVLKSSCSSALHLFPGKGESRVCESCWGSKRLEHVQPWLLWSWGRQAGSSPAGWWCLQLPLPTLCSNGWACRLPSKSLHCPTLVKLGWVDFRVKHCLLGPAQLPSDLPRLIKSEQTSAYDHSSSNLSDDHFFCDWSLGFCFSFCLYFTADL